MDLLQLLLQLIIILMAAKLAGAVSKKFGQPAVFGELLIGVILGPSLFSVLHQGETIKQLSEIGVIMLMFIAGMETDLREMKRTGKPALLGAIGGVVLPLVGGYYFARYFGYDAMTSLFIGTILTATSVSISAQTLMELGQLRSKEGAAILGGAVIDDVLGIIVLSVVIGLTSGDSHIGMMLLKMAVFFAVSLTLGMRAIRPLTRLMSRIKASEMVMAFAIATMFLLAYFAEEFGGVAAITGSYIAGILFATTEAHKVIEEKMSVIAYSFFAPIFFVGIGIEAELGGIGAQWVFALGITVIAVLAKVLGCGFGGILGGFNRKEALRFGIGMISRGEVALIVASIGLSIGLVDKSDFSIMILMTLVTTLITPILLRLVFPKVSEAAGKKKVVPQPQVNE